MRLRPHEDEVIIVQRVLIADDDRKLLALLERGFRYEGFEVCAALNGEQCLAQASAEHPDVIVLDIGMPGMDGLDVCRRLRRSADVPVIMLTARDEVQDKVRALDLGADDYVTKPVGTTVRWVNMDGSPHHVVTEANKIVDSGPIAPGKEFSFPFTQAGRFVYRCAIHPTMLGTITVQAP